MHRILDVINGISTSYYFLLSENKAPYPTYSMIYFAMVKLVYEHRGHRYILEYSIDIRFRDDNYCGIIQTPCWGYLYLCLNCCLHTSLTIITR